MAVEWYVLVGVGWLAVDIELKWRIKDVWIVNDFQRTTYNVQQFNFHSILYAK